jgi:hypothetical protein
MIGRYESACINNMYAPIRAHIGVKTRTKQRRDKIWTYVEEADGTRRRIGMPVEEHPPAITTPRFIYPTILSGELLVGGVVSTRWELSRRQDHQERWEKIGLTMDLAPEVHVQEYHLMLAKIGHAYACAEFGDKFTPVLTPWLLGDQPYSNLLCQYVGSDLETSPRTHNLHTMEIGIARGIANIPFVVAHIRLFAQMSGTNHVVVAGLAT